MNDEAKNIFSAALLLILVCVCCRVFFFVWDSWRIGLRFVFGVWGRGLGANVRADVRVYLAGNGRFYLECTVGGPAVSMASSAPSPFTY